MRSLLLLFACTVYAADVPGWRHVGSARDDFDIFLDRDVHHGGQISGRIECLKNTSKGTGTLEQDFRPDEYLKKRIRISAWTRGENAGRVMIYGRAENGAGQVISFGNSLDHAIRGTLDWRKQEVVINVPEQTTVIQVGLILVEKGKAWIDDILIEEVDKKVRLTNPAFQPGPRNPRRAGLFADHPALNLDFEQAAISKQ
jgi:hypothetical protein